MRRTVVLIIVLVASLCFPMACRTGLSDQERLQQELGGSVPLWVDLECSKRGKPRFKDYSVLKMPDEKVVWALARLGEYCRVYGALIKKTTKKTDLCDIRFRSKDPVVATGRCRCVPGRYKLEEGRPTSERCCEKHPDSVYCRPTDAPEPESDQ